jgi:cytochrome P450
MSFPQSVAIGIAGCVVLFLGDIIYNLFLNPLSKYPGPRRCAVSRLFVTYQLLRGTQVQWIHELHQKYGQVVRVAPDQLSFTDERAWADICGSTRAAPYGMPKDERLNDLVGGETINPDATKSRAEQKHSQLRQAFAPALTKSALRKQEEVIHSHVDSLIQEVLHRGQAGKEPLNMVDMFNFTAYNIFSDLFLGDPFDLFADPKYRPWVHSTHNFAKATIAMGALQHFGVVRYILAFIIRHFGKKHRDAFMSVCVDRFDRRAARQTDRPDLFHFATSGKKQHQFPLKDMRDFSPFLMIAGGETTPTSLSGILFHLLHQPEKFERLVHEIRSSFKTDEEMSMDKVFQLKYLTACIDEGLRVYPPVPAGLERVVPKGGAPIAGEIIPGGTVVLVPHYAMFHDKRNFTLPDEFLPERWLLDADPEFAKDRKNALQPFSVGPHSCFGKEYVFVSHREPFQTQC